MKKLMIIVLTLSTLLLSACGDNATATAPAKTDIPVVTTPNVVIAEGRLEPVQYAELSFLQPGTVAEILAQAGDEVTEGDVIARLEGCGVVEAEIEAARLEETLARQALETLQRNSLKTTASAHLALLEAQKAYESEANGWNVGNADEASRIELAIDRYVEAEENFRDARQKLESLNGKDETNHSRQQAQEDYDQELEDMESAYARLLEEMPPDMRLDEEQADMLQAIATLELARDGAERLDSDQLQAAGERLQAATTHLDAAQEALETYELRAPFTGTLLSLDLTVGESAAAGLPVAYVADTSRWQVVTTDLAEVDVPLFAVGSAASIELDAFPDEVFNGEVTEIDPVGRERLGDMTYQVTVTLSQADARFLWNMTATVSIEK